MGIKKLHILIIKSFFLLFVPSLFITLFVLILQFIWVYADDLIGKGLNLGVLMELLYYLSLMNFTMALPIAVMLASIMTFGNMGEHFELTAAKSAGISLYRIMVPIFVLASIFTLTSFVFANNIFPYASLKTYSLVTSIRQQHPALRIQEGIFNYDVEGYVIRVAKKNHKTNMMYDFMIYDHSNYQGNKFVIVSDSGTVEVTQDLNYMIISLFNGFQYEELKENKKNKDDKLQQNPYHIDQFKKQKIIIPLTGFDFKKTDLSMFSQNFNMLNVKQLGEKIDSLDTKLKDKVEYYYGVVLNNDILKNQIRLRNKGDSVNFMLRCELLNNLPADKLKIVYDIDSAFKVESVHDQKELSKMALTNAENLSNRLTVFQAEYESRRQWLVDHKIALNKKYVFALACFIFFFIGAPLGSIIRKGGFGLTTIISVVLFLVFYIMVTFGEKIARDAGTSAFFGIWFAVFVFVPFELFLFYKASKDAVVVNYDYYVEIITKFIRKYTPNFLRRSQFRKIRKKRLKK